MDYLLDLLEDPVEFDDIIINDDKFPDKFPDEYRPYPFNNPDFIFVSDPKINAKSTNTKLIFWKCDFAGLQKYLKATIEKKFSEELYYITPHLTNEADITPNIKKYYDRIYDLVDIIIVRHTQEKDIVDTLKIFLDLFPSSKKQDILVRMHIYIGMYLIKNMYGKSTYNRFIKIFLEKLFEFKNSYNVDKYFTSTELNSFITLIKDLWVKHNKILGLCDDIDEMMKTVNTNK